MPKRQSRTALARSRVGSTNPHIPAMLTAINAIGEMMPASTAAETDMFSREPLIVKQNMPAVRGVLVVAEGAEDIRVRTEMLNAVAALMDISMDQIEILY